LIDPGSFRVLVVDDDPSIRAIMRDLFTSEGYAVRTAGNGVEALAQVAEWPPQVIFLDVQMPVMDGPQFAAAYRALPVSPYPPARVIVVTASNDLAGRCNRVRADGCVAKPFDLDELLDLVEAPYHAHAHVRANQLAS